MNLIISIALGIVLAVIILAVLPDLLAIGIILIPILIGIAFLILIGIIVWQYPVLLTFVALGVLIGGIWCIQKYLYNKQLKKETERKLENKRLRKLKKQAEKQNEDIDANEIRQKLRSHLSVPYKDADNIEVDKFSGNPQNLTHPVAVSRGARISSMLEFEIIDLIKRGYLNGVHYENEWFFDLRQKK
jgi:membrane protein implicated in regulation of membrane protease activity